MARKTEYRKKRKEQVHSLRAKSLFRLLTNEMKINLGLPTKEARIVADLCFEYLTHVLCDTAEGQIRVEAFAGLDNHARRPLAKSETKKVTVTVFAYSDIELLEEFGIKAMQTGRILRIIEETYQQDALFDLKNLIQLVPMSKKTLRNRLIPFWEAGIMVPISGLSHTYRDQLAVFREVECVKRYLDGADPADLREELCLGRSHFRRILRQYRHIGTSQEEPEELAERFHIPPKQVLAYRALAEQHEVEPPEEHQGPAGIRSREQFLDELRNRCGFSPALAEDLEMDMQETAREITGNRRGEHTIVYYAVTDHEPAGKSLDECELAPVQIDYITAEDREAATPTELKWERILRYSTQARYQGTYLNQIDLAFLIGISPAVIQRLCDQNEDVVVPTRGQMIDMGPAVSHAEEIISLHMQGYTETQIKRKTGHDYESLERYIDAFTKVAGMLVIEGMNRAEIRKIMDCSRRLVDTYCELWHRFNTEEFQWWAKRVLTRYRGKKKAKKPNGR